MDNMTLLEMIVLFFCLVGIVGLLMLAHYIFPSECSPTLCKQLL